MVKGKRILQYWQSFFTVLERQDLRADGNGNRNKDNRVKGKKIVLSFLLFIICFLLFWPSFTEAICFRLPLDSNGWYLSQDFGVWNSDWDGYHLGEDYIINDGNELPVYATADGIVKHVNTHTGYGYVVIIEHDLGNSNYVCSVYGHLRQNGLIGLGDSLNIYVSKGQLIGYLSSNPSENGGYNFTHLHFGIRSGAYTTALDQDGKWRYRGYGSSTSIRDLWYDPSNYIVVNSCSTYQPIFTSYWDGGLYKSIDGGKTWTSILDQPQITSVLGTGDIIYVGVLNSSALRSKDGGVTWENLSLYSVNQIYKDGNVLYAGTFWGAYKSFNGGDSWTCLNDGFSLPFPLNSDNFPVNLFLFVGDTGFAAAGGGLFRSIDDGKSWVPCNNGLPGEVYDLVSLEGKLFASIQGFGVYRSMDGGNSWGPANNGLATQYVSQLLVVGKVIFAGSNCEGSVFKSLDGGDTWIPSGNGIEGQISSLIYTGSKFYASGLRVGERGQSLIYESEDGSNWRIIYTGFAKMPNLELYGYSQPINIPLVDFDGDGETDVAAFHLPTEQFFTEYAGNLGQYGWEDSMPLVWDYDGDGKTEVSIYHIPTNQWFVKGYPGDNLGQFGWGGSDSVPVPGDYNGDGIMERAFYHSPTNRWFVEGQDPVQFGWNGAECIPVPGDYDGDGKTDMALYHVPSNQWFQYGVGNLGQFGWGGADCIPVPGDYNGDGVIDIAVYHVPTNQWFVKGIGNLGQYGWGGLESFPIPGDYDGDGVMERGFYRPSENRWFIEGETDFVWGWGGSDFMPITSQVAVYNWFRFMLNKFE